MMAVLRNRLGITIPNSMIGQKLLSTTPLRFLCECHYHRRYVRDMFLSHSETHLMGIELSICPI